MTVACTAAMYVVFGVAIAQAPGGWQKTYQRSVELLLEALAYKSLALRQQAAREPDAARAKRLTDEADRLRERADALTPRR